MRCCKPKRRAQAQAHSPTVLPPQPWPPHLTHTQGSQRPTPAPWLLPMGPPSLLCWTARAARPPRRCSCAPGLVPSCRKSTSRAGTPLWALAAGAARGCDCPTSWQTGHSQLGPGAPTRAATRPRCTRCAVRAVHTFLEAGVVCNGAASAQRPFLHTHPPAACPKKPASPRCARLEPRSSRMRSTLCCSCAAKPIPSAPSRPPLLPQAEQAVAEVALQKAANYKRPSRVMLNRIRAWIAKNQEANGGQRPACCAPTLSCAALRCEHGPWTCAVAVPSAAQIYLACAAQAVGAQPTPHPPCRRPMLKT